MSGEGCGEGWEVGKGGAVGKVGKWEGWGGREGWGCPHQPQTIINAMHLPAASKGAIWVECHIKDRPRVTLLGGEGKVQGVGGKGSRGGREGIKGWAGGIKEWAGGIKGWEGRDQGVALAYAPLKCLLTWCRTSVLVSRSQSLHEQSKLR